MSSLKYIAGDFPEGTRASERDGRIVLTAPDGQFVTVNDAMSAAQVVTEENKQEIIPKVGWGIAGLAAFGPLGALAGLVLGGRGKEVCALCTLRDGRRFMVLCSPSLYQGLVTATMSTGAAPPPVVEGSATYQLGCFFALLVPVILLLWWWNR